VLNEPFSSDRRTQVWSVTTGELKGSLRGTAGAVLDCVWLQSSSAEEPFDNACCDQPLLLLSCGADKLLRLWDARSGRPRAALAGHAGPVQSLAVWWPDCAFACSCSAQDRCIKARMRSTCARSRWYLFLTSTMIDRLLPPLQEWDVETAQCVSSSPPCSSPPTAVACASQLQDQPRLLASAHADGSLCLWDARQALSSPLSTLQALHAGAVATSVAFAQHGGEGGDVAGGAHLLLSAGRDSQLCLVDIRRHRLLTTLSAQGYRAGAAAGGRDGAGGGRPAKAALSTQGQFAAAGGADGAVYLWDLRSGAGWGRVAHGGVLRGHSCSCTALAWRPGWPARAGAALASADKGGLAMLWEK